jgi:hypothetical protein
MRKLCISVIVIVVGLLLGCTEPGTSNSQGGTSATGVVQVTNSSIPIQYIAPTIWNGNGYTIIWVNPSDGDIYFTLLDTQGKKIGNDAVVNTAGSGPNAAPVAAWNGTNYGVAWIKNDLVTFTLLSATGQKLTPDTQVSTNSNRHKIVDIVWNGTEYGLALADFVESLWPTTIYLIRVSSTGAKIGSDITLSATGVSIYDPIHILWNGNQYAIIYMCNTALWGSLNNDGTYFFCFNAMGTITVSPKIITNDKATYSSSICWNGNEYAIVTRTGYAPKGYSYLLSQFDVDGSKISSDTIIPMGNADYPSSRWSGQDFGIISYNRTSHKLDFRQISPSGLILSVKELCDAVLPAVYNGVFSGFIWNGSAYALSWIGYPGGDLSATPQILFVRISRDGVLQ